METDMAKLTKTQRHEIESALSHAKRAFRYVMDPRIAICHKSDTATTTLHYSNKEGALYPVTKEYGSDLTGLADCIRRLEQILIAP